MPESDLCKGIEFNDVHFKYPTRPDVPIFSSLYLMFQSGHVTAVVGPSGSGKSTITSLLLRFYDPDLGSILIGGQDIRHVKPDWIRSQIGIVSQVNQWKCFEEYWTLTWYVTSSPGIFCIGAQSGKKGWRWLGFDRIFRLYLDNFHAEFCLPCLNNINM